MSSRYKKPGTSPSKPRDAVEQEDAFIATTLEVSNWAQRNRTMVTILVVAVGLFLAGFIYYGNYRDSLDQQAAAQLEQLQQRLTAGDQEGVRADLELFIQRFGSTTHAAEARMTLGLVTADLGDPEAAVAILDPISRDVGDPIGAQAAGLLAAIYEDAGNYTAALGLYMRLADRAELGFQVRDALVDGARIRTLQGDHQGAIELYDRLLDDMEEFDPDRGVIEMRRAELVALTGRGT